MLPYLEAHGFRERDWARDSTTLDRIEALNGRYIGQVEAELIGGATIERIEAQGASDALTRTVGKRRVIVVGAAGLGKSCTMAQIARRLQQAGIPWLALRMDDQVTALTAETLGKNVGLPMSPALVLAGSPAACDRAC